MKQCIFACWGTEQSAVVSFHPQASTGEIPAALQVPLWRPEVEVAWTLSMFESFSGPLLLCYCLDNVLCII